MCAGRVQVKIMIVPFSVYCLILIIYRWIRQYAQGRREEKQYYSGNGRYWKSHLKQRVLLKTREPRKWAAVLLCLQWMKGGIGEFDRSSAPNWCIWWFNAAPQMAWRGYLGRKAYHRELAVRVQERQLNYYHSMATSKCSFKAYRGPQRWYISTLFIKILEEAAKM